MGVRVVLTGFVPFAEGDLWFLFRDVSNSWDDHKDPEVTETYVARFLLRRTQAWREDMGHTVAGKLRGIHCLKAIAACPSTPHMAPC